MAEKKVSVRLVAEGGGQVKAEFQGIGDTGTESLRGVSTEADGLSGRLGRLAGPAGLGLVAAAAAAAAAALLSIGTAIETISEFDRAMSELAAVTRATAGDMEELRDVAKDLGSSTEFTAKQAAEGLTFLARAGFDAADSMAAIPAVLDLATAAGMDLGRAADISSNIMSAFGIAAADASSATDILAAAASRSNTDVQQLGDAMSYVGPIAAALDISMNDAAAAIGVLSDAGIQGSMAGTSLRQILSSLVNPVGEAATAIKDMGLTLEDVSPETSSLTEIMNSFAQAGIDASDAMTIFGDRGGPAILALTSQADSLAGLTRELRDVEGAAADMASIIRDNLRGDLDGAMSAVQGLIIALGDAGLTAILRGTIQAITELTRGITAIIDLFADAGRLAAEAARDLLGMADSAIEVERATDAVQRAMNMELDAFARLMEQMPTGTTMSKDLAEAKLRQAEAFLAAVDAMQAEALQIVRQGAEYQALERTIGDVVQSLKLLDAGPDVDGTFAPTAALPALQEAMAALEELRQQQQDMLDAASLLPEEYAAAQREIDRLAQAIALASNGTVTLTESAEEAAAAARLLADELILVNQQNRIAAGFTSTAPVAGGRGGVVPTSTDALLAGMGGEFIARPERRTRSSGGSGGRSSEVSEAQKQAEAIQSVVEALETEINAIGMVEEARRVNEALRQAGVELYSEEGQAIADMVQELVLLESQQSRNASAMQAIESSAQSAFTSFVTGASSAREAVGGLLSSLADMAANAAFQSLIGGIFGGGGGAFANFAGAVFGGGGAAKLPSFDGGGYTGNAPRSGGLDGKGGFLAMMHPQEMVTDRTKSQAAGVGNIEINLDMRGSVEGVAAQVQGLIRQQLPEISRTVVAAVADGQSRGRI